ncbi:MAG: HAMP domain-containing sensor histidine kinase [Caulobacterales bacterium]
MATNVPESADRKPKSRWPAFLSPRRSLSGRLLLVTILCVMLVEALIFIPSAARFRMEWLRERLNNAQIAALAVQAAPGMRVTGDLAAQLLDRAGAVAVYVNHDGKRELLLGSAMIPGPASVVDFRTMSAPAYWFDTIGCLTAPKGRFMRVVDTPMGEGDLLEMVLPQHPLQEALRAYACQVLASSLLISAFTGALVYLALWLGVVRPILHLSSHIEKFRDAPQDATALIPQSRRKDEIGRAENALADMESQVRSSLQSKERLAALGGAVARISHDLRNSLSTAQVVSERLSESDDPKVRQSAPRLERALQRAIGLAENTLSYGRAEEPAPKLQSVDLRAAIEDAAAEALAQYPAVRIEFDALHAWQVNADRENLHRILVNLMRNSAQAIEQSGRKTGRIAVHAISNNGDVSVSLTDDGPGVPQRVKANLFAPFSASTRNGGSGLGLAIARELARAMGGELEYVEQTPPGARFDLRLRASVALQSAKPAQAAVFAPDMPKM